MSIFSEYSDIFRNFKCVIGLSIRRLLTWPGTPPLIQAKILKDTSPGFNKKGVLRSPCRALRLFFPLKHSA